MNALASVADRLGKLIPRLASTYDGEVIATVHALAAALKGSQFSDRSEISTVPLADAIKALLDCPGLSGWERTYCCDIARLIYFGKGVSRRQTDKIAEIYRQRIGGAP